MLGDAVTCHITCPRCGEYDIGFVGAKQGFDLPFNPARGKLFLLSGITRNATENGDPRTLIIDKNLSNLLESVARMESRNPLEIMDDIILFLQRESRDISEFVNLEPLDLFFPLFYLKNANELNYLLGNLRDIGLIEQNEGGSQYATSFGRTNLAHEYRLAPDGWCRAYELKSSKVNSKQAFVAMWFDEVFNQVWVNGFKPALEETGFIPIRIDMVEHNGKICDRIVAEIRRCGLLVADFTGNRGGVYFEAGFAMGLGIPVIWTCRNGDIDQVHFDTRQYNHIIWDDAEDLKRQLINRIEATVPKRV